MKFVFITDPHLSSVSPSSRLDNFVETSFAKVEEVLQVCVQLGANLLMGGDLFATPTQPDFIKNRLKELLLQYGITMIGIPGNHDLLYYSTDYIDKTSYKALVSPQVAIDLNAFPEGIMVGGVKIVPHIFGEPFPVVEEPNSIILSHCFYAQGTEEKLSVTKQDVYKSGAKFVCFGHDHNQYPIADIGGTFVVRPGALTRGTSHTENRVRVPSYAVIDTNKGVVEYRHLSNVLDFKEAFREKYDVERERTPVTFDDIQRFIDEFRNAKSETNPYDILLSMKKPENIVKRSVEFMEKVGLIKQ